MANSKIQNSYLCHVTKLMTSSDSFKKEKVLLCILPMFSTCSRQSTAKHGKYVKELSLSFPKLKTEFKNSYWFVFYCRFCLTKLLKNDSIFLGHIALSQLMLKIMS